MSKVFVDVVISFNAFIAGPNNGAKNSLGDGEMIIHRSYLRIDDYCLARARLYNIF